MADQIYTVQLTYVQLQTLIALVDNERHAIESWQVASAQERRRVLAGLTALLFAAASTAA